MKKRLKKILSQRGGFTVVSVMTAFVILLIGVAMVTASAATASRLAAKSEDVRKASEARLAQYYEYRMSDGELMNETKISVEITVTSTSASQGKQTKPIGTIPLKFGGFPNEDDEDAMPLYWYEYDSESAGEGAGVSP